MDYWRNGLRRTIGMDNKEYLEKYGVTPDAAAIVEPKPQAPISSNSVDEMRQQLELKKLQIEIDKLEKPDTSIDYYSKMLELQKENFKTQLDMATQQGDLKLEIEKLKLLGSDGGDDFMEMIKPIIPLLPQILKQKTPQKLNSDEVKPQENKTSPAVKVEQVVNGGEEVEITKETTVGELQEYTNAIKEGKISYEEALEDFKASPYANVLTDEQFKAKFDKIKEGKTI